MIVLDTNVLSELMKPRPAPRVSAWVASQRALTLYISAVTEAEVRYGVALLAGGQRRDKLNAALTFMLSEDFAGRVLPFDSSAAVAYASIAVERRKAGRPISQADTQIAAIARSHGAPLATRDVADFDGCGIDVINPWEG